MSEPFMGEVRTFGFDFAPKDWAFCDGQLLAINQYQALFALMGTNFGGDGRVTFGLPDLRGRGVMHYGPAGPGLSGHSLGEKGGYEKVRLTNATVPHHNHIVTVADAKATTTSPSGAFLAQGGEQSGKKTNPWPTYADAAPDKAMSNEAIEAAGRALPHENRQPYQVVNFCIALDGLYPPRS